MYIVEFCVNESGVKGLMLPFFPTQRLWNTATVGQLKRLVEAE